MPAKAFREGVIAAKSGDASTCNPHAPDTETHAAWTAGYAAVADASQIDGDADPREAVPVADSGVRSSRSVPQAS